MTEPIGPADLARAERILVRVERMTIEEANAVADAYPPLQNHHGPPELTLAFARARGMVAGLGFRFDAESLGDRIDDAAIMACQTQNWVLDFIGNFGPEAQLISATHHAWTASLLGDRLAREDADLLMAPWRAIPADPDPDWFGPRTRECDAFLESLASITSTDANRLAERWDRDAHEAARVRLLGVADLRARHWGLVAGLAIDAVERAITGAAGGFRALALDHPWRYAAYAAGAAASAECVRDAAPADLIETLETPWVEAMGRRGATARD